MQQAVDRSLFLACQLHLFKKMTELMGVLVVDVHHFKLHPRAGGRGRVSEIDAYASRLVST